jgi:8-oxo-dGTP diphosphatase
MTNTITAKIYCLGFCFNLIADSVILIKKTHPKDQRGLLNGLGGRIGDQEATDGAMAREFEEESGFAVPLRRWSHFATLICGKENNSTWIFCFVAFNDDVFRFLDAGNEGTTEEKVRYYAIKDLHKYPKVANTDWLIRMALPINKHKGSVFTITEFSE